MFTRQPTCVIVYISISAVFCILLFLQGFFPMKNPIGKTAVEDDLPQSIAGTSVNVTSFYPQHIGRVVIMVIDALRWDFVQGVEGHQNMPYTSSVVDNHEACLLPMKAAPPTVTMPRIKALVTGTVPNFIDVVMNLGSGKVSEDSFLKQAKEHGRKSIFFGDDTWLKMFPDMFIRSDGTTSFFVSDFTQMLLKHPVIVTIRNILTVEKFSKVQDICLDRNTVLYPLGSHFELCRFLLQMAYVESESPVNPFKKRRETSDAGTSLQLKLFAVIPGIGEKKAKLLLNHFRCPQELAAIPEEQFVVRLTPIVGEAAAQNVYKFVYKKN